MTESVLKYPKPPYDPGPTTCVVIVWHQWSHGPLEAQGAVAAEPGSQEGLEPIHTYH